MTTVYEFKNKLIPYASRIDICRHRHSFPYIYILHFWPGCDYGKIEVNEDNIYAGDDIIYRLCEQAFEQSVFEFNLHIQEEISKYSRLQNDYVTEDRFEKHLFLPYCGTYQARKGSPHHRVTSQGFISFGFDASQANKELFSYCEFRIKKLREEILSFQMLLRSKVTVPLQLRKFQVTQYLAGKR